jgi:CTP:phosphocholine cytidylyltransferase-like protein
MGDCTYQYLTRELRDKYESVKCSMTRDEFFSVYNQELRIKTVKQRKNKIISLKTKLLDRF